MTTRGELAALLARYATALAPPFLGHKTATDSDGTGPGPSAAELTDAGDALRRLTTFLRSLHPADAR
ncbi:hypothetical protein [Streptacidiphilus neutrinimicus]|uniref:hypothetical protein n=1 Tax=Streptacidiphilus neutrinimicus TaxID=105420 RepID=UPI0005A5E506|nr:hypothetical protein [Streptacidiphilus neutrinimicus]